MMWVDKNRHMLARLAASVSALAVLMDIIAKFVGGNIVFATNSYMSFATIAILFAVYFRLGGLADSEKK